jgi:hypothetical protein
MPAAADSADETLLLCLNTAIFATTATGSGNWHDTPGSNGVHGDPSVFCSCSALGPLYSTQHSFLLHFEPSRADQAA